MKRAELSRRDFMRGAAAAGAAYGAFTIFGATAKGQGKALKVGLIGCGGRGKGALVDCVEAAKFLNEKLNLGINLQVAGVADWFQDRATRCGADPRFAVPKERCFGGPTGYRKLLETDVDLVLMGQAPVFRPLHLEAAVKAGKHCFVEKPVAVDPPGCRRVIAAGAEAKKKGLAVIAGTEMRHDWSFVKTHQSLAVEKAFGKLYAGRVAFCIGHMFSPRPIQPKTADDLVRTWQSWIELSGDHIVEQHVHNIDIANWFAGRPPVSAVGFGARARRAAGNMFDFFSVDFDYGDDVHIHSMCRQVDGCWGWTGHEFIYEKGKTNGSDGPAPKEWPLPPDLPQGPSSHHQEQIDTLYYVVKGIPIDQAKDVAESTAAAVMGRTSAYTGQMVKWDEMMVEAKKKAELYDLTLRPTAEELEKGGEIAIPEEGVLPAPGKAPGGPRAPAPKKKQA